MVTHDDIMVIHNVEWEQEENKTPFSSSIWRIDVCHKPRLIEKDKSIPYIKAC